MKNKSLLMTIAILILAMSSIAQTTGSFTDSRDGKVYKTVKIGTQTWMAENLAYKAGYGCWAYNNNDSNVAKYGYLYDWKLAKTVCPAGWHLPSDAEWLALIKYLGGDSLAGGKLKMTTAWVSPNTGANNSSGFSALPGGFYYSLDDTFNSFGQTGDWWSASESSEFRAWNWVLGYDGASVNHLSTNKDFSMSVRCIKD